jgi:hypothetical protein
MRRASVAPDRACRRPPSIHAAPFPAPRVHCTVGYHAACAMACSKRGESAPHPPRAPFPAVTQKRTAARLRRRPLPTQQGLPLQRLFLLGQGVVQHDGHYGLAQDGLVIGSGRHFGGGVCGREEGRQSEENTGEVLVVKKRQVRKGDGGAACITLHLSLGASRTQAHARRSIGPPWTLLQQGAYPPCSGRRSEGGGEGSEEPSGGAGVGGEGRLHPRQSTARRWPPHGAWSRASGHGPMPALCALDRPSAACSSPAAAFVGRCAGPCPP